jgi:prephenate dehydrogenase
MKSLAIMGFGQFGHLAATQLAGRFDIGVHDAGMADDAIAAARFTPLSFEQAAGSDVVILAVPVQAMEGVIADMVPMVRPGATVIDVASVKMLPSQWLAHYMPETVHVVATHPLFGPQSAERGGIAGRQLVICPIRGERHLKVAALGEELGLRVRITTAEEHDREMAYVQALTHLIGRSLSSMHIPDEELKTQTYQHLLDMTGLIGNDSFELFTAMQTMNPFAPKVVGEFVVRAGELLEQAYNAQK